MATVASHEDQQRSKLEMDPIRFEVIRSAFDAAADEMGAALRKSAYSHKHQDSS